jgi:hypothetical protein
LPRQIGIATLAAVLIRGAIIPIQWYAVSPVGFGGAFLLQFMYSPLPNYPERGYGGSLERVGEWAYVHE